MQILTLVRVVATVFSTRSTTGLEQQQLVLFVATCTSVTKLGVVPVLCACGRAVPSFESWSVVDAAAVASTETIYTPHLLSSIVDGDVSFAVHPFSTDTELNGTAPPAVTAAFIEYASNIQNPPFSLLINNTGASK